MCPLSTWVERRRGSYYSKRNIKKPHYRLQMSTMTKTLILEDMKKNGDTCFPGNTIPTVKYGGGSVFLWGCLAAGGTSTLHKIDGIMMNIHFVEILKWHLKTSPWKLHVWVQIGLPNGQTQSIHPKLLQSDLKTTKWMFQLGLH